MTMKVMNDAGLFIAPFALSCVMYARVLFVEPLLPNAGDFHSGRAYNFALRAVSSAVASARLRAFTFDSMTRTLKSTP